MVWGVCVGLHALSTFLLCSLSCVTLVGLDWIGLCIGKCSVMLILSLLLFLIRRIDKTIEGEGLDIIDYTTQHTA